MALEYFINYGESFGLRKDQVMIRGTRGRVRQVFSNSLDAIFTYSGRQSPLVGWKKKEVAEANLEKFRRHYPNAFLLRMNPDNPSSDQVLLWWTTKAQSVNSVQFFSKKDNPFPRYIHLAFTNRMGRRNADVYNASDDEWEGARYFPQPYPQTPLAEKLLDYAAVAFKREDLELMEELPGIITNCKLELVSMVE